MSLTTEELNRWVNGVLASADPSPVRFPTDDHLDSYIDTIDQRSDREVVSLLERMLPASVTLHLDEIYWTAQRALETGRLSLPPGTTPPSPRDESLPCQRTRRLKKRFEDGTGEAWEGLSWVIDLVRHSPLKAIRVLDYYAIAHMELLPDHWVHSVYDSMALIRSKFIGVKGDRHEAISQLHSLDPDDFEFFVAAIYLEIGYEVTKSRKGPDGGVDLVAKKAGGASQDYLIVQCKRVSQRVGEPVCRDLLGTVSSLGATQGVLVGLAGFTSPALRFSANIPRIRLIDGGQLVELANENLGHGWLPRVDRIVILCRSRILKDD